jgi:hypothetical protein
MSNREQLKEIFELIAEIIEGQQKKVEKCAHKILPHLTAEDLLQPNDFPELENHPHFRYEEGMLAGIYTVQMALQASYSELIRSTKSESH